MSTPSPIEQVEEEKESGWEFEIETFVQSGYLDDDGAKYASSPVVTQSLTVSKGNCYGIVEYSKKLAAEATNPTNMVGSYVGCTKGAKIGTLDVSGGYFAAEPFAKKANDFVFLETAFEFSEKKLFSKFTATPFASAQFYIPAKRNDVPGGIWLSGGVKTNFNLSDKLELEIAPKLVYNTGVYGYTSGLIGVFNSNVNYSINDHLTWSIGIKATAQPHTDGRNKFAGIMYTGFTVRF